MSTRLKQISKENSCIIYIPYLISQTDVLKEIFFRKLSQKSRYSRKKQERQKTKRKLNFCKKNRKFLKFFVTPKNGKQNKNETFLLEKRIVNKSNRKLSILKVIESMTSDGFLRNNEFEHNMLLRYSFGFLRKSSHKCIITHKQF